MTIKRVLVFLLLSALPTFAQVAGPGQITFTYTLATAQHTSAGVFDSTGALVRTIWSNKIQTPDTYLYLWDGLNDAGAAVSAGSYQIKVLENNAIYTWDGPIGFTGSAWTGGGNTWSQFGVSPGIKLTFVGGIGWTTGAYSEAAYNIGWISSGQPNTLHILSPNYDNANINFTGSASDGTNIYLMNAGAGTIYGSWTTVFNATSGMPVSFTNGTPLTGLAGNVTPNGGFNNTTISVIDSGSPITNIPTGIAVQRSGNLLAIAHGSYVEGVTQYPGLNLIRLFDKTTGSAAGTSITITNPQSMAFSSAGLWVVSNGVLDLVTGVGTTNAITSPISGLSNAVWVAVNGSTNHVFVLDGGTSQQVKEFDASYNLVRTYGDLGGYEDGNPNITSTRMNVDNFIYNGTTTTNGSWITVPDSNDIWISDAGTDGRIIHVSPSNTYVDQILVSGATYNVTIDHENPTRVFSSMLEFTVNYNVPNLPGDPSAPGGNGSWVLARNWAVGAPLPPGNSKNPTDQFQSVEDLSNGRTYAQIESSAPGPTAQDLYEYELPTGTAQKRNTGINDGRFGAPQLERDGSLMNYSPYTSAPTTVQNITKAALTGFDVSGNPTRSAATNVATFNTGGANDPYNKPSWSSYQDPYPTTGGVYPMFNPNTGSVLGAAHLGGAIAGRSSYIFEVYRDKCMTRPDFTGSFPSGILGSTASPCPGAQGYGGHDGIQAKAEGHHIIVGYDGQYATWGNKFSDFWEDGLVVGEFTNTVAAMPGTVPYGWAANISKLVAATVGNDIYMYLPTEDGTSPLVRWHFSNLGSIHEFGCTTTLGGSCTTSLLF